MKESIKKYIELEVQAIQNIPIDGVIENVLEIIFDRVHQMDGKVIVSGMGKAGNLPIIGVGGIMNSKDALDKIEAWGK
ncbi:hypothetical protein N9K77_01365 [bacterium]|nr:hypothetical protein [bacterium]